MYYLMILTAYEDNRKFNVLRYSNYSPEIVTVKVGKRGNKLVVGRRKTS